MDEKEEEEVDEKEYNEYEEILITIGGTQCKFWYGNKYIAPFFLQASNIN